MADVNHGENMAGEEKDEDKKKNTKENKTKMKRKRTVLSAERKKQKKRMRLSCKFDCNSAETMRHYVSVWSVILQNS